MASTYKTKKTADYRQSDGFESCDNCKHRTTRYPRASCAGFCDMILRYVESAKYCNHYESSNIYKMMMNRDIERHDAEMEALHQANCPDEEE